MSIGCINCFVHREMNLKIWTTHIFMKAIGFHIVCDSGFFIHVSMNKIYTINPMLFVIIIYSLSFGCVTILNSLITVTSGNVERKKRGKWKKSPCLIISNQFYKCIINELYCKLNCSICSDAISYLFKSIRFSARGDYLYK